MWKIYSSDWAKFSHISRFQCAAKWCSGIFEFLKCILRRLIKVIFFLVFCYFGQNFKFRTAINRKKRKIKKITAYRSCITLKSTNINEFGSVWMAVFFSIFRVWSSFFLQFGQYMRKVAIFLQRMIFPIFLDTATM